MYVNCMVVCIYFSLPERLCPSCPFVRTLGSRSRICSPRNYVYDQVECHYSITLRPILPTVLFPQFHEHLHSFQKIWVMKALRIIEFEFLVLQPASPDVEVVAFERFHRQFVFRHKVKIFTDLTSPHLRWTPRYAYVPLGQRLSHQKFFSLSSACISRSYTEVGVPLEGI